MTSLHEQDAARRVEHDCSNARDHRHGLTLGT
jgi:hypothetical protein